MGVILASRSIHWQAIYMGQATEYGTFASEGGNPLAGKHPQRFPALWIRQERAENRNCTKSRTMVALDLANPDGAKEVGRTKNGEKRGEGPIWACTRQAQVETHITGEGNKF